MLLSKLTLLAGLAAPAAAFFAYLPPGHPGAQRKIHVSDSISKGFAFINQETPLEPSAGLSKASLRKRGTPVKLNLFKRVNDFKVETDNAPSQKQSAAIDQDGTDFSYFSEVSIGSDTVYMLLDTGSSAIWVMGQDCTSDACKSHQLSSSPETTGDTFNLTYNSGSVSGELGQDQMQFAGLSLDVTIGLADQTSDQFDKYAMDGILGLARSANGTDFNAKTFLEVVQAAGALEANVFGVWLDRAASGQKNGEINFGAPDTSRFSGDLNWVDTDMDDITVWKIPAGDVLVNGKSSGLSGRQAIIDTGTTYMFVPPSDADAIFANVEGATLPSGNDMYNLPCDTTANITFVFNNVAYEISPKDYVGPSVGGGLCYTHIVGMDAAGDDSTWLLGDTFLKNVYTVFDADQNRIGFGLPSSNDTSTSTGTSSGASATGSATGAAASATGSESAGGIVGGGSKTGARPASATSEVKDEGDAMGSIGAGVALDPVRAGAVAMALAVVVGLVGM